MNAMLGKKIRQYPTAEDRACPRLDCDINTVIIVDDKRWPCKITDLSELGLGISSDVKLHVGDMVVVVDPGTRAQVIWADTGRAGLQYF